MSTTASFFMAVEQRRCRCSSFVGQK